MNQAKWVLLDRTNGATTKDGSKLTPAALAHIAEAVQAQVNGEFAAEWGAQVTIRVGANATDIKADEWAYGFVPELPDAPGASAYHDITNRGVPFSLCAVTTCTSLLGADSIAVDVSHEILETAGDQGANQFANDNHGQMHAVEMCDAVEIFTYPKTCKDGTVVQVSNFLLRAWFNPGAKGPYDYMTAAGLKPAAAPPGPLKTAPGQGGNYQIIAKFGAEKQVFGAMHNLVGTRRKGMNPNWTSRACRRLRVLERASEGVPLEGVH